MEWPGVLRHGDEFTPQVVRSRTSDFYKTRRMAGSYSNTL